MNQQAGLNLLPTEGKAKTRIYMFVLIFSRAGLSQQRDHGGGEISYWAPITPPVLPLSSPGGDLLLFYAGE